MGKIARSLIVIITTFGLVSCGIVSREVTSAEPSLDQSTFKKNFSIGSIVQAHEELLTEGPRSLSGMETGPLEPFVQSHEFMILQVDSDKLTTLMGSIQSGIEETLSNGDAKVTGSGGFDGEADPIAYFSYSYTEGPFYGVIDVWGVLGEDTQFVLISQITESMNNK